MIPGKCLPSGEFKQSAAKFLIPTQAAVSLLVMEIVVNYDLYAAVAQPGGGGTSLKSMGGGGTLSNIGFLYIYQSESTLETGRRSIATLT